MARRAVEQELSRERIIQVARELFATQGYRAVSMRSVGKALGYSHGSLYYHFREKAELFYGVIVSDFIQLDEILGDVMGEPSLDGQSKIEQMMLTFIRFGLDNPHQYEIMFLISDDELVRYSQPEQMHVFERFSALVRETIKAPLDADAARTLSLHFFMSLHGFITHHIHSRKSFADVSGLARSHVRFLCRDLQ